MAATILAMVVACSDDNTPNLLEEGKDHPTGNTNSNVYPEDTYAQRMEVPRLKTGNRFVSHEVTVGGKEVMNYCLEMDPERCHSRWVAFRFDATTRPKNTNRASSDSFQDDPKLPSSMQVGADYFGSPYNRGHLCASYDRLFSEEANVQTFYMSNMSPMEGNFNSYYWVAFEQLAQTKGRNTAFADTLYVCKGGYIDDEEDLFGYIGRRNGLRMAVPGHYFMALLRVKSGNYTSIAFWVDHNCQGYRNGNYAPASVVYDCALSVDELEAKTGIDFFCNLPDAIENSVEANYNIQSWK